MARNAKASLLITNALSMDDTEKIAGFDTAKEKWEALRDINEGTTDLNKSIIYSLTMQLNGIKMKEEESIGEYHGRVATIVNQLEFLGKKVEDWEQNLSIVRGLNAEFKDIANLLKLSKTAKKLTVQ